MINIKIIAVGSLKEKYLKTACDEYIKRLGSYCKLSVTELKEYRFSDRLSADELNVGLAEEASRIKKNILSGSAVVALCIEGEKLSSTEFSKYIADVKNSGQGKITFIIGSSHGLHDDVKSMSDLKLSLSDMTFPHQLFRVMLLEQIYRGFMIIAGKKYHK